MEVINNIIQTTLESFDFAYCIVINILTYFIITIINEKRNHKDLTTWGKRRVLILIIILLSVLYYISGTSLRVIINSSILAPVFWSWILKPICKHFKIDYKQLNLVD